MSIALSETYRFVPSKAVTEVLASLAKALPKLSVRSYGSVIGIRNGMAAVTNGFALLTYHSPDFEGQDLVLDRNLFPSGVKFPDFEGIIRAKGREVPVDPIVTLCRDSKGKPYGTSIYLKVVGDEVSLVYAPKAQEGVQCFNPAIVGDYLRMIPKGNSPIGAWLDTEGQLRIEFAKNGFEDHGPTFTVIAVSIALNA